jgi:high-affinity iron transporter
VYGELKGVTAELFEGTASFAAVVVLTYMIFWMSNHAKKIKGKLQERIDVAITTGELFGITSLAFIAVFREGLETVLFLSSTFFIDALGTVIGVIAGSAIVLAIAVLLLKGTYRLDLKKFFRYTSLILIVFAAGLTGYGVHELIEAGESSGIEFGLLSNKVFDINPPVNLDGSYPLLHEKGVIGSVLKALVGYDGNPELLRIVAYLAYWLIVGAYVYRTYRRRSVATTAE